MRTKAMLTSVLALVACGSCTDRNDLHRQPMKQVANSTTATNTYGDTTLRSEAFHAVEKVKFDEHAAKLVQAGRWPTADTDEVYEEIGQYGEHSRDFRKGWFGAYTFHQPAFDQAMRSWRVWAKMSKGGDVLEAVNPEVRFDASIVGSRIDNMYGIWMDATVVAFIDAHHVRLDKRSRESFEEARADIRPPDYQDMCGCRYAVTITVNEVH